MYFAIGNFTPVSGQNTLVIWTENPNNYPDGNVFNDTMMITLVSCDSALYGTYTVGTPTSHFPTLEEVVDKLSNCMLAGPVTFVMASVITPKLQEWLVSGASATKNTITFTSSGMPVLPCHGFDAALL